METDLGKASVWWNGLFFCQQQEYNLEINGNRLTWLNSTQIEELYQKIYKPVYQQIIDAVGGEEKFCELAGIPKKQVDFKSIFKILDKESCYREVSMDEEELDNLKLFIELLAKSSTFAHKAHKELNRLNA